MTPKVTSQTYSYSHNFEHERKCELCEKMFLATLRDSATNEFRCKECRTKPVSKEPAEPYGPTASNKQVYRRNR